MEDPTRVTQKRYPLPCAARLEPPPPGAPDEVRGPRPRRRGGGPPSSTLFLAPVRLEPRADRPEPLVFGRAPTPRSGSAGTASLRSSATSGISSARAIATESVDSRDWMRPNRPRRARSPRVASAGRSASSGAQAPSDDGRHAGRGARPTGLDRFRRRHRGRSRRQRGGGQHARVDLRRRRRRRASRLFLPRGDMLVFGGDISYPVATADEIYKRLVLPWNEQLRKAGASSRKRVLLGVPGNHDWYDGLDGFGRLFRRRIDEPFRADDTTRRRASASSSASDRDARSASSRGSSISTRSAASTACSSASIRSVRAFFRGIAIKRRRRLVLRGYVPVQEASYFALPLAPGLDLFGRRSAARSRRLPPALVLHEAARSSIPVARPLRRRRSGAGVRRTATIPGARMLAACRLSLERDRVLYPRRRLPPLRAADRGPIHPRHRRRRSTKHA